MSQIRAKQIKLENEGDLVVGNGLSNGSVLSAGELGQTLHVGGSALAWQWNQSLYDPAGVLVLDTGISTGAVNYFSVNAGTAGTGPEFEALGPDTNIDLNFIPKGTGEILSPVGYSVNIASPNALVTKQYVDSSVNGLDWKNSVRVATTSDTDTSSFVYDDAQEPSGVVYSGVTTAPTIDGVTLADGDRILIKNDTTNGGVGNGLFIYDATAQGFRRASDADNTPNNEVSDGMSVFIEEGNTQGSSGWVLTSPAGEAELGTDVLVFTQFAGSQLYTAGSGLAVIGSQFKLNDSSTIGVDPTNKVIVTSNDTQGNMLISTGTPGEQAVWAQLNLSNQDSITGILDVSNGGTGLSTIAAGRLLVGTGGSAMTTITPGPATDANTAYVLKSEAGGPAFGSLSINQLIDVDTTGVVDGSLLQFNQSTNNWEVNDVSALDKFVRITANDTTSGFLNAKVAAGAGLAKTTLTPGANEQLEFAVNVDSVTLRVNGSDNLAVAGGLANQQLVGQGAATDASWAYVNSLFNATGDEIFVVEGTSENPVTINTSAGGASISTGGNLNLNSTTGDVVINGATFPSSIPDNSILVANQADNLEPLTTGGAEDTLMIYNATTSSFSFVPVTTVGGNTFGAFALTGNATGDLVVSAATPHDTLTVSAGAGVAINGVNTSDTLSISFTRSGMVNIDPVLTDTFPFFDANNAETPSYVSFADAFEVLGVPTQTPTTTGILTQVSAGEWLSRSIVPSTLSGELGITVTNGDGVAANPTVGLDVTGLSANTVVDPVADYFVMFDSSANKNTKVTVEDMLTDANVGTPAWASANAAGTTNEQLVGFFTNLPVTNENITVFFNGLSLKQGGWTRSGNNLTLVDSVNGYSTDAGDVVTASYEY